MALATRCPHCQTTFRVAHDQLKLRAGLVRCGACKQIFNGAENLLRAEDLPSTSIAVPSAPPTDLPKPAKTDINSVSDETSQLEHPVPRQPAAQHPLTPDHCPSTEEATAAHPLNPAEAVSKPSENKSDTASIEVSGNPSNDPLQRMTLMEFAAVEDQDHANDPNAPDTARLLAAFANDSLSGADSAPDELDRTIDELQRKPWRKAKKRSEKSRGGNGDKSDSAEPGFVKSARRQQRIGRTLRIAMGIGSVVLLIGAFAQSTVIFRDQIAARLPQSAPFLSQACAMLGCRIELPAQIDMVSIEASELQAVAMDQNVFSLVALLRNRAATVQAWPNIELTLNDAHGKPVVRRVFVARDYVPTLRDQAKGFAPNSEQPVKLTFALSQLQASDYRIYLFYP